MRKSRRRTKGTGKRYHILLWLFIGFLWLYMLINMFPSIGKVTSCLIKESREVRRIESEYQKLKEENKKTEQIVNSLKQGKGWEEEIRSKGWVKEGEILIKIEGKLPQPEKKKENFLQKILDWLTKGEKRKQ
ncbi:hypothetical protein H5T87_05120 [bacterium]|nr:hypothetical protein [bacterium]